MGSIQSANRPADDHCNAGGAGCGSEPLHYGDPKVAVGLPGPALASELPARLPGPTPHQSSQSRIPRGTATHATARFPISSAAAAVLTAKLAPNLDGPGGPARWLMLGVSAADAPATTHQTRSARGPGVECATSVKCGLVPVGVAVVWAPDHGAPMSFGRLVFDRKWCRARFDTGSYNIMKPFLMMSQEKKAPRRQSV